MGEYPFHRRTQRIVGTLRDAKNPEYDAEKAKEYWACQANSGS